MVGYKQNGSQVIEFEDLWRAMQYLPTRESVNKEGNGDTHIVYLGGDEDAAVIFDWDVKTDAWKLRNKVVFAVNEGVALYDCNKCGTVLGDHLINKVCTKKKCKKCGEITNLE